ncbi:hypothetical protein KMZ15_02405 [Mycoavidus sp. HKI]|uniref:hypothetical protein n=1 Tax=Mycoavidus sp. HKI TaxID=2840467 RepID=UPI001CBC713E|nr:hypothetical protein [Mycoavidus sp. HKI]UAW64553.1 hypothetical protein KMZ15_02405 [Mycoavidus sp. HKI]
MKAKQETLLRAVVAKHGPEHIKLINVLLSESIDDDGKLILSCLVNNEFLEEGINPDFSPNTFGCELEDLIDIINK